MFALLLWVAVSFYYFASVCKLKMTVILRKICATFSSLACVQCSNTYSEVTVQHFNYLLESPNRATAIKWTVPA